MTKPATSLPPSTPTSTPLYIPGNSSPVLRNTPDTSSFNRYVFDISTFAEIPIGPLETVSSPVSRVVNAGATAKIIEQSTTPHHGRLFPGSGTLDLLAGGFTNYNYKHGLNKTYGGTALYVYDDQAYRSDYIGNIIFGDIAASKNVSLKTTLAGSNSAQYLTNLTLTNIMRGVFKGDEFRDVEAVTRGYTDYLFGNILGNAANGGFVLYPNKPNTNMVRSVYSK